MDDEIVAFGCGRTRERKNESTAAPACLSVALLRVGLRGGGRGTRGFARRKGDKLEYRASVCVRVAAFFWPCG